jgi:hypothetical protein
MTAEGTATNDPEAKQLRPAGYGRDGEFEVKPGGSPSA